MAAGVPILSSFLSILYLKRGVAGSQIINSLHRVIHNVNKMQLKEILSHEHYLSNIYLLDFFCLFTMIELAFYWVNIYCI